MPSGAAILVIDYKHKVEMIKMNALVLYICFT